MPDKRTYAQRADTIKRAVSKRRKKIRDMAIAHMGGACQMCGYERCSAALDIHHRDPKLKAFGISEDGITRSWKRVQAELAKCILICANCHREVHAGVTQLPTVTSG